jgi:hypothetical protein
MNSADTDTADLCIFIATTFSARVCFDNGSVWVFVFIQRQERVGDSVRFGVKPVARLRGLACIGSSLWLDRYTHFSMHWMRKAERDSLRPEWRKHELLGQRCALSEIR